MERKGPHRPRSLAADLGKQQPFALPEQEAFLNLIRTGDQLMAEFNQLFAEYGLTEPQYNALRILRGHGRPMPVYSIAEQMVTRQPDITRLVTRMEQADLVVRRRCDHDRRVCYVELTRKAAGLLKKLDRPLLALHRRQLGHLGPRKLQQLSRLLTEARDPGAA